MKTKTTSGLLSAAIGVLVLRVVGAALQLGTVAFVGSQFGLAALGLYGMLWATAMIFRVGGALGLDLTGLKNQSLHWHRREYEMARAYARRDTFWLAKIWVVIGLLAAVFLALVSVFHHFDLVLALQLVWVAFSSSFQKLWSMQLRAANRVQMSQFLESVAMPLLGLLFAVMSMVLPWLPLLWGQCFALGLLLWIAFMTNPLRSLEASKLSSELQKQDWPEVIKLGVSTFLTALSSRMGIFFAGFSSLHAAGTYEIAQRIQSVSAMTVSSVGTVILPIIRIEYVEGDKRSFLRLVVKGSILSTAFPILIFLGNLMFGKEILDWLLHDASESIWLATTILLAASVLNGFTGALSSVLAMTGRGGVFALVAFLQVAFLSGGIVLTGQYDAVGVATWVFYSECLRSVMLVMTVYPQLLSKRV